MTQIWSQGKGSLSNHSCAILSGEVKCWGDNFYGQLGDGNVSDRHIPVAVSGLSGVTAIALGQNHSCAILSGGVKCWGDNYTGQLGDGSYTERYTPVDVNGLTSGVTAIALGQNHSCAIFSGGVKCWGLNNYGQLGNGDTLERTIPVDVTGLASGSGVTAIALGQNHSCAILSGGVKCWGYNGYGQLGDVSTTDSNIPVDVSGLSGVSEIALGGWHSCALTSGGGVECWGLNNYGQLGDVSTTDSNIPAAVSGLASGVSEIALGQNHSCALTSTGGVKCWGMNAFGELGDGGTILSNIPVDVSGLASGVSAIALGSWHSCALTSSGGVKCWGYNGYGQLGDNTLGGRLIPTDVLMLVPEIDIVGNTVSIVNGDTTPDIADDTDFGRVPVSTPVQKTFTIQNMEDGQLILTGTPIVTVTGTGFGVTVQPITPIMSFGTTTFSVQFQPSEAGIVNGTVSIANDDSDENPYTFTVVGEGIIPKSEMSILCDYYCSDMGSSNEIAVDGTLNFGEVLTNQSKELTLTIRNTGDLSLQLTGDPIVAVSGTGFSISSQPTATSLGTNGGTVFTVQFIPTTEGVANGSISIANSDNDENPYTFTITGEGKQYPFDVQGNGVSIANGDDTPALIDNTDFGNVLVGNTGTRTFTIKNLGEESLYIYNIELIGSFFGVVNQSTPTIPLIIPALGSTTLTVQFAPVIYGTGGAAVNIYSCTYNTLNESCDYNYYASSFYLSGTGIIVLHPINDKAVALGETLTFIASANGRSTDRFFGLTDKPKGATIDPLTGRFSWLPTEVGTFSATVVVSDINNYIFDQETITITVGNTPPSLTPIGNWTVPFGELLYFTATATDKESNSLTFSLQDAPAGAFIDSKNGNFSWQTTKVGVFPMTITVTDSGGIDVSESFTVTVTADPILTPIGDKTTAIKSPLTFTVTATHPTNAPLAFSLKDSPAGATLDPTTGVFNWTATASGTYAVTIVVSERDGIGSVSETINITVAPASTQLTLQLNSDIIFLDGNLGVSGKLIRYPAGEMDVQPIQLQLTAPNGNQMTATTQTNAEGTYVFANLPAFNQEGIYSLQAQFAGTETLGTALSTWESVTISPLAGYALLVQGRTADNSGMDTYNKSLNRVYQAMKLRGFIDENIEYLNYNPNQTGITVDGTPSYETITAAFNRLQARMNADPAPLFIVMVDHGDAAGGFHLDNGNGEKIIPTDLSNWLNTLEKGLNTQALAQPRVTTLGFCYSGSFIPTASLPGRIFITSAAPMEESYKGPTEPDQVRSGEYFVEGLFAQLGKGKSLKTSFELATQSTEIFTRIDNDGFDQKYQDNAAQHPLLDDNGDKIGNNVLYVGNDSEWAESIYLGLGPRLNVNSPDAPAEILTVTPAIYLDVSTTSADLFATVNNPARVLGGTVQVDIRTPSATLPNNGLEQTEQLEVANAQRLFLHADKGTRFVGNYGQFTEPGRYDILYFVQDMLTGSISPLRQSSVYRNKEGNTAPLSFKLRFPENESETSTVVIFSWEETLDPDWDKLTYTLMLATDPNFTNVIYLQENLRKTVAYINSETPINDALNDSGLGLRDGAEYFWRVDAVDSYGGHATSETFSFTTNNTNAPPSVASLNITSALDFSELNGATLQLDGLPEQPLIQADQGRYDLLLPPNASTVTLNVPGFQPQTITPGNGAQNILLTPQVTPVAPPGTLQFSVATTHLQENQGIINVLVSRLNGANGTVSVRYATADGNAIASVDYTPTSGTLTWTDGDTLSKRISITLTDDSYFENAESFLLSLFDVTGGASLDIPNSMTLNIVDNDPETAPQEPSPEEILGKTASPTEIIKEVIVEKEVVVEKEEIVYVPSPATENNTLSKAILQFSQLSYDVYENEGKATISVTREGNLAGEVSVNYILIEDTATADDFSETQGTLTWEDGDDEIKTFEISVVDDESVETSEKVILKLTEVTGQSQLGERNQTILVILDNDTPTTPNPGTLQFIQNGYEFYENAGEVSVSIERVNGTSGEVSADYSALTGSALLEEDYLVDNGTLTWADGKEGEQTFNISIVNDEKRESDEQFYVLLSNPTNGAILGTTNPIILTIKDGIPDLPPLGNGAAIDKGGNLLDITAEFFGGTSVNGGDYQTDVDITLFEAVAITGLIEVGAQHIGEKADILIVGGYTADVPEAVEQFYMLDTADNILQWDVDIATLQSAQRDVILVEKQVVDIFVGHFVATGRLQVYFAYRLADGTVVFNGQKTINVVVREDN